MRWSHPGRTVYCALLVALLLCGCVETPQVTPTPVTLRIATSSTLSTLIDDLSTLYQAERDWVTIQAESINSEVALKELSSGAVDLAFVSWLPANMEAPSWHSPIAYDAVALIVNPSNPIEGVSLAQLRDIFQGRVVDWSPFGWADHGLIVVSREDGSGTRAAFEQHAMQARAITPNAIVQAGSDAVIDYVSRTPGAVAYVSRARVGATVKAITLEGIQPSSDNAAAETYPLGRVLFVLANSEPQGATRDFVSWLLGDEGQQAIAERGFARVN